MSAPTLTTIPPELLLTIISHLPSSNSLYALSHTSRSLASFLQTHAATVCNSHIQKHHRHAAAILLSEFVDGWLVPKHHCIIEAEERWDSERASRSASLASDRRVININNCCFRTQSAASSDPVPPRSHHVHDAGIVGISSPSRSPTSPNSAQHKPILASPAHHHHHQDLSLSLSLGLPLRLSRPGPHYLTFLERYFSEIVARQVMYSLLEKTSTAPIDAAAQDDAHLAREHNSKYFDFMVGNYCVRKWLSMCDEAFSEGLPEIGDVQRGSRFETIREKFAIVLSNGRERLASLKSCISSRTKKSSKQNAPAPRMLFGEIESEDEKAGSGLEKDAWAKGLLWYYGISSQLAANCPSPSALATPNEGGELKRYVVAARRTVGQEAALLRPRIKNVWSKIRCRGRFELLED